MARKRTLRFELYESFRRVFGWPAVLVGLLGSIGLWMIDPSGTVPTMVVVPLAFGAYVAIAAAADLGFRMYAMSVGGLPKVLAATQAPAHIESAVAILLLEPTELLSQDALVSIYTKQNKFEVLLGVGWVFTIQEDGRVQVLVSALEPNQKDKAERLTQNDADLLESLLVKSTLPRAHFNSGQ